MHSWCKFFLNHTPCLVGSSRIWLWDGEGETDEESEAPEVDEENPPLCFGRELAGGEYLALQGIDHSLQHHEIYQQLRPAQMVDLAGNAFNAGVVCAVMTAMLGSFPRTASSSFEHIDPEGELLSQETMDASVELSQQSEDFAFSQQ